MNSQLRTNYDLDSFDQFAGTIAEIKDNFGLRGADKVLYRGQEAAPLCME